MACEFRGWWRVKDVFGRRLQEGCLRGCRRGKWWKGGGKKSSRRYEKVLLNLVGVGLDEDVSRRRYEKPRVQVL